MEITSLTLRRLLIQCNPSSILSIDILQCLFMLSFTLDPIEYSFFFFQSQDVACRSILQFTQIYLYCWMGPSIIVLFLETETKLFVNDNKRAYRLKDKRIILRAKRTDKNLKNNDSKSANKLIKTFKTLNKTKKIWKTKQT